MNNLWNGGLTATPGVDVVTLDDAGNVALTSLTANLSLDGLGQWRTTSPGWGTRLVMYSTSVNLQSIDTQTATDPYVATTLQDRIVMSPYGGNAVIDLHKKDGTAAGGSNQVRGYTGASLRWGIQLGTTEVEGTGNTGSRFFLQSYDNNGAFNFTVMYAGRNNGKVSFPQGLTGVLTLDNGIDVVGTSAVLGGNTDVYLRPNGKASGVGQTVINAAGDMSVSGEITAAGAGNGTHAGVGLMCRNGSGGAYSTGNRGNIWWSGSAAYVYIDSTAFPLTAPCDYRLKQEIKPIGSCWDKVKALRPVSFQFRDYDILKADGVEHWGFIAHELQESLLPSAATGAKDAVEDIVEVGEDGQTRVVGTRPHLQGPDPMSIIAALTAALQEAQQRIEALEARLVA